MASNGGDFQLPPDVIAKMRAVMSPDELSKAMFQVVKRTGDGVKRIVVDAIREDSTVNLKAANKAVTSRKPKGDIPVGEIVVSGKPIPAAAYANRASKRNGANFQAMDGQGGRFKHGFKAIMRNVDSNGDVTNHTGIFYRKRLGIGGAGLTQKQFKNAVKGKHRVRTPGGFAERLPLKQVFGPPAAKIMNAGKVREKIRAAVLPLLEKNVRSQISRFAGGK